MTAYRLVDDGSLEVTVADLGATITRVRVPDPAGGWRDVALGFDNEATYLDAGNPYLGATVGRYANRIAGARVVLDGTAYRLDRNEPGACLHGGAGGFHTKTWECIDVDTSSVTFELVSPDGDQGFPGRLTARARYAVTGDRLTVLLTATTDALTVVNLTNHLYVHLGDHGDSVADHVLQVPAVTYLPVDLAGIPLGYTQMVEGTPLDLREGRCLDLLDDSHPDLARSEGLDLSFLLGGLSFLPGGRGIRLAARLEHPASGRFVEVHTNQPALHVYTLNDVTGVPALRDGRPARAHGGVALEAQIPPDAPNQPGLPSPVLRPGELYSSVTTWWFGQTGTTRERLMTSDGVLARRRPGQRRLPAAPCGTRWHSSR